MPEHANTSSGHLRVRARGTPASHKPLSRRAFLQAILAVGLLGACRPARPTVTPKPVSTTVPGTPKPTFTPLGSPTTPPSPTPTTAPSPTATLAPSPTSTKAPTLAPSPLPPTRPRIAIAQAASYDPALVRRQVRDLLDGIGGLGNVLKSGDRVAIKVNLTGGTHFQAPAGVSATESYMTHPEVVHALGELLRDAGAREIYIVEAVYDDASYRLFGYEQVARTLGATLIDLNRPDPYPDFASKAVGTGWFTYEAFTFNHILEEVDAFISVAKMKTHCSCGITASLKNLVGLVPAAHYRLGKDDWWRSALHGAANETRTRLPRAIIDLNRARPIDLALIDGIKTSQGGEVPRGAFAPVQPGVLIAGKDPVATDAVATAVMGFDPSAAYPTPPFINGDNHLSLAHDLGLGTNRLEEIEVVGAPIQNVRQGFAPC